MLIKNNAFYLATGIMTKDHSEQCSIIDQCGAIALMTNVEFEGKKLSLGTVLKALDLNFIQYPPVFKPVGALLNNR